MKELELSPREPGFSLLRKQRGFLPGLAPATLIFKLRTHDNQTEDTAALTQAINIIAEALQLNKEHLWKQASNKGKSTHEMPAVAAAVITTEIQRSSNFPIQSEPSLLPLSRDTKLLVVPSTEYSWKAAASIVKTCFKELAESLKQPNKSVDIESIIKHYLELKQSVPKNVNTLPFLIAAQELGIPVHAITKSLYRYGWGENSRLMDSSLTQFTSSIGCNAARNKIVAKHLLREAGLPVITGIQVNTPSDAWQAAQKLGLPIVIKPLAADGGLEVHVKLTRESDIKRAAQAVLSQNHQILVERYYEGKDYRFQIFRGKVFRCIERIPGGVTGDGVSTIRMLLQLLNNQPDRGQKGSGKKKAIIEFDMEARRLLNDQGLTVDSVPNKGSFIALRGAANISRGGEMRDVIGEAHPDNLLLATRAAIALNLDLAGVDIIMNDIGKSWFETGAAICEVNAQPQMSSHHKDILSKLVPNQGRIRIDIILGIDNAKSLGKILEENNYNSLKPEHTGLVGRDGIFIGTCQYCPPLEQFESIIALLNLRSLKH